MLRHMHINNLVMLLCVQQQREAGPFVLARENISLIQI